MDVQYETIQKKFEEIKSFITHDLGVLVNSPSGVNYTAALLIACACETLAWFKYGKQNIGDQFLRDMMLPEQWKPVSKSLYDALRDGLAHAFETMNVKVGSKQFDIGVSWGNHKHLTFNENHSILYLNMKTMADHLLIAIANYEQELKNNPTVREKFFETMRKMRNGFSQDVSNGSSERAAWEVLLK